MMGPLSSGRRLAALPELAEGLAGLGQPPTHRRLSAAHDGRHLRRGEPLQVPQDQDRAIRQRDAIQNEPDLLRQLQPLVANPYSTPEIEELEVQLERGTKEVVTAAEDEPLRQLANWYAGLAYARAAVPESSRPALQRLWRLFVEVIERPLSA